MWLNHEHTILASMYWARLSFVHYKGTANLSSYSHLICLELNENYLADILETRELNGHAINDMTEHHRLVGRE